ncbi:MAG: hypothetical protein R3A45_05670 [Bdellovibrionota bacterium]
MQLPLAMCQEHQEVEASLFGRQRIGQAFGGSIVDMQDSVNNDDAAFQASMNEMANALVQEISFYDSFTKR